jgi:hypothetical protein
MQVDNLSNSFVFNSSFIQNPSFNNYENISTPPKTLINNLNNNSVISPTNNFNFMYRIRSIKKELWKNK